MMKRVKNEEQQGQLVLLHSIYLMWCLVSAVLDSAWPQFSAVEIASCCSCCHASIMCVVHQTKRVMPEFGVPL